jgi:hypothetical protein
MRSLGFAQILNKHFYHFFIKMNGLSYVCQLTHKRSYQHLISMSHFYKNIYIYIYQCHIIKSQIIHKKQKQNKRPQLQKQKLSS